MRFRREAAHRVGQHVRARQRGAELLQARGGEGARDDRSLQLRRRAPLPERERARIDRGLREVATAVVDEAGERVAAVAARALAPVREADAGRADQAVLVQVRDDARAGLARRRQRAPAEGGAEVVGVHDPRTRAPDRVRDLLRAKPPARHPERRAPAPEQGRIALEQLGILADLLAHEPQQISYGALLAAALAVAVVEEEDQPESNLACRRS